MLFASLLTRIIYANHLRIIANVIRSKLTCGVLKEPVQRPYFPTVAQDDSHNDYTLILSHGYPCRHFQTCVPFLSNKENA